AERSGTEPGQTCARFSSPTRSGAPFRSPQSAAIRLTRDVAARPRRPFFARLDMAGVIQLQTEIPGPKSRALMARRTKAVPKGVPAVTPPATLHAAGARH